MRFVSSLRTAGMAFLCGVIAVFGLAVASPAASASPAPPQASVSIDQFGASAFKHEAAFNPAGCPGLAKAARRSIYVAAFVLGYCPSVTALQTTSWGKSFMNRIVNGACRVPAIVRAATAGKYSTC